MTVMLGQLVSRGSGYPGVPATAMAARLRMLRVHTCLTQYEFAPVVDRTASQVSRWELGSNEPTLPSLKVYAEVFGMSVSELLAGVM